MFTGLQVEWQDAPAEIIIRRPRIMCRETIAGFTEGVNLPQPACIQTHPNGEGRKSDPRLIIRRPHIMLSKKTACFKLKQAEYAEQVLSGLSGP